MSDKIRQLQRLLLGVVKAIQHYLLEDIAAVMEAIRCVVRPPEAWRSPHRAAAALVSSLLLARCALRNPQRHGRRQALLGCRQDDCPRQSPPRRSARSRRLLVRRAAV